MWSRLSYSAPLALWSHSASALENATNEIVSGVSAFEGNRIDTRAFPNYIRAPDERHKDIDKQVDGKKVS